jgi:YHS domain-containing protein
MVKDPVCGMEIEPETAFAKREHMGKTYYLISFGVSFQFYFPYANSSTDG